MKPEVGYAIIIGAGIALIYWLFRVGREAVNEAADSVAAPIADAILAVTGERTVNIRGGVVLPNGNAVPFDKLHMMSGLIFDWQGARYQVIAPRRSDGNYNAKRI